MGAVPKSSRSANLRSPARQQRLIAHDVAALPIKA
jgi:hypothetical protein